MSRIQRGAVVVGAVLVAVGVAFIYWPAGLIVAGLGLVSAGLTDFEE